MGEGGGWKTGGVRYWGVQPCPSLGSRCGRGEGIPPPPSLPQPCLLFCFGREKWGTPPSSTSGAGGPLFLADKNTRFLCLGHGISCLS